MLDDNLRNLTVRDVVDEIARSVDPLAFENPDVVDMEKRRQAVYFQIDAAFQEYSRRERRLKYDADRIDDLDMPW